MGVSEVALLGPLAVDGDSAVLAPRDRVVLAALAIRPGELMSAERLADALWGEHLPASWRKVVPGCILRLRRLLGTAAIETTRYGYRLALPADDVDTHRFERLLQRGRELLELGDADRAQRAFGEALGLWRGQPLMELDGWEPGRIEAERLTELRLEVEECRLDAALRAGRHAEVLAEAQAGVAQQPLRERRWALLALAQYQAGRQGEALRTLHRARTVLATELGLDPSPDLAGLEQAILRQDPALVIPPPAPDPAARCPYLGLFCYDIDDAETFFGRDREIADCLDRLETTGMLAVVGPSGSGKSSLVRAGVAAALARAGRRPFVVTAGSRPTVVLAETVLADTVLADAEPSDAEPADTVLPDSVLADTEPAEPADPAVDTVLMVDQFEEAFTVCTDPQERMRFFAGLVAEAKCSPVVICLRADHVGRLAEYPDLARLIERGLYLLGPMDEAGLRAAITGPAESAGLLLEPGLVDLLVREVEGQPGALPLLSHALRRTWERREGRTLTVAGYQATGGIRGCVAQSAEQLHESLTTRQRPLLRQVLLRLVSAAQGGDPVRTRVPRRLLLTDPDREQIVERLVAARLVTADGDTVQIAHESLARAWPRLSNWLDDDVEGQRILGHLTASADAWNGMGRPDSELYRGSRLSQALEWQHDANPVLTAAEADFLAAGAAVRNAEEQAAAQQAQHQARTRRRTRLLLSGVAALLAAALVAGVLAVHQQREREAADLAAAITEAHRLDDASRGSSAVDQQVLLAVEADKVHDSPDTRAVLADLLSAHPMLIRSLTTEDQVQTLAASPDGTTLLVGEGDHSGTIAYSAETLSPTHNYGETPGWAITYRSDGQQVLLAGRGAGGLGESVHSVSAALTDPSLADLHHLPYDLNGEWIYANDAAYSADGGSIAISATGSLANNTLVDSAVVVWRGSDLSTPVVNIRPMPSFAVALSPDGRLLYIGTRQPALTVIDVASGQVVNSLPLPGTIALLKPPANEDDIWHALSDGIEVSPDGQTLAIAEGNDVVLLDATTLTERHRLRGHTDIVRSLEFSHDGRLLAAGSSDNTAVLWDLATGGEVARLAGHADAVVGLAFSPDDGTLYTGGLDRHVLVWDLAGRRQFVTRIVDRAPLGSHFASAVPSPEGKEVVYQGTSAAGKNLQFLDMSTGQLSAPGDDQGADPMAAWLPPDDRQVVTAAGRNLRVRDGGSTQVAVERPVALTTITALTATPDGAFVIVGERSGGMERVEAGTLAPGGPRLQFSHQVNAVGVGPGNTAVALLDDKTYAVVDLGAGTVLATGDLGITPTAAAISPDGSRLAVGGSVGDVGLLDLNSHEWIAPPTAAHRQFVDGITFTRDGQTLVTSSFDGGVRVWDGQSGATIAGVQVGQQSPAVPTVLPDGHDALVATRDGAVYRLDTRFEQWTAFACAVAGRNLTDQEWRADFGDQPYRSTCPTG